MCIIIAVFILKSSWFGGTITSFQSSSWRILQQIGNGVATIRDYPWTLVHLAKALFLSGFIHSMGILTSYIIFRAIHDHLSLIYFFLFLPVVQVMVLLPVSIGGLGVQEGVLILLLGRVGVSKSVALSYALLIRALSLLISLPGGILYALNRSKSSATKYRLSGDNSLPIKRTGAS